MSIALAEQRVLKGFELLDQYFGDRDWVGSIDVERLSMYSSFDCLIGQLFEKQAIKDGRTGWTVGLELLGLSGDEAPNFGFIINHGPISDYQNEPTFLQLTTAWKEYLQKETSNSDG